VRYELSDYEWTAIKPMLPNKPRGVRRVNDRRVLNGIFWVPAFRCAMARSTGDLWCTTCYNRFVRLASKNDVTRGSWIRRRLDQGACASARRVAPKVLS
jgi:transposase